MVSVAFGVIFSIALALMIPNVSAAPLPNDTRTVGIQLSQTCTTMLKNNITTTCPSYEDLVGLGWDDSLLGSGEFEYDEHGFYHRGMPQYYDVHELYRYDDYHILIDPPNEVASRTKLIIISPSLPEYVPLGGYEKVNDIRVMQKDRYVAECKVATITSENWTELISDTIYYLRNGCNQTSFNTEVIYEDYQSSMDKTTSKQYKHDKWLKESLEKCKEKC